MCFHLQILLSIPNLLEAAFRSVDVEGLLCCVTGSVAWKGAVGATGAQHCQGTARNQQLTHMEDENGINLSANIKTKLSNLLKLNALEEKITLWRSKQMVQIFFPSIVSYMFPQNGLISAKLHLPIKIISTETLSILPAAKRALPAAEHPTDLQVRHISSPVQPPALPWTPLPSPWLWGHWDFEGHPSMAGAFCSPFYSWLFLQMWVTKQGQPWYSVGAEEHRFKEDLEKQCGKGFCSARLQKRAANPLLWWQIVKASPWARDSELPVIIQFLWKRAFLLDPFHKSPAITHPKALVTLWISCFLPQTDISPFTHFHSGFFHWILKACYLPGHGEGGD